MTKKFAETSAENVPYNPVCIKRKEISEDAKSVLCFQGYGKISHTEPLDKTGLIAEEGRLENAFLIARFDGEGNLIALIRKSDGKNYIEAPSNQYVLYKDNGDAWDFEEGYLQKDGIGKFHTVKATWGVQGGIAVAEFEKVFGDSKTTHRIRLSAVKDYLEFETEADWRERGTLLRAEFVPAVWSDTVNCGIQFGNFVRSTREDTAIERAQEEICAQRYVDVSNNDGGLAFLAEAKYGFRVKDGKILVSLLRGSEYPGENADFGKQVFRYTLYPHAKAFAQSDVAEKAYEFLYPIVMHAPQGLPLWNCEDVLLETVKVAEDRQGLVFRFYEPKGKAGRLRFLESEENFQISEISLDEEENYGTVIGTVNFAPFEIKTFKIIPLKRRIEE